MFYFIFILQEKFADVPTFQIKKEKLCQIFPRFGFNVEVYNNLFAEGINQTILTKAKDKKLKKYNSLIICIMSHGGSGVVYGSDGKPVSVRKLQYAFNSFDCPQLHDKPKIIFIEACRIPNHAKGRHFLRVIYFLKDIV